MSTNPSPKKPEPAAEVVNAVDSLCDTVNGVADVLMQLPTKRELLAAHALGGLCAKYGAQPSNPSRAVEAADRTLETMRASS